MKRYAALGIMICVAMCLMTGAFAQAGRFSVQFDDTPLSRALDAFKRFDPNFQFALAPELADTKVTVSLDGVTVDEALTIVLGQAGLMSVKDAGVNQIRQKAEAKGPRGDRPALRLPPPVFITRAAAPGEGGGAGVAAAPAAGSAAGAAGAKANPPLRLIIVRFADPGDMADLFGGSIVYGGSSMGGSSGGNGSSGGGYGSSGGSY
ncbi:MAG: hypothetical protein WCP21_10965 [Armatimonadota bacterium]